MKKGKVQKSEARRRGSASRRASSECTGSSAPPPSPPPTPQPPLSGVTSQPSSESIPPQPVPQALPAPEVSRSARGVVAPDTDTKASPRSSKTGSVMRAGPRAFCSCSACPYSSACWHRLGLCHSRTFDVLLPRAWPTMLGRGFPNLLTFYRRPASKHSTHGNSRAPSPQDCCCGSGSPGSCLLYR
ncbi:PREDICTED: spermatogenesis-associated protein 3 [Lipotes vexillifer]|uniref:Spermatogenesis-associated protein 3 n=1 Tax=Lipotes vexillifer TaxID=118797 RepID=A0A340XUP6_LIPVE|nr:PREDICTED: spermatogenesis-associated protein 3 [Lipotes vexillifer]